MSLFGEVKRRVSPLRKPEHLLIVRNDHMGDLILTLPLIGQSIDWLGTGNVSLLVRAMYDPLFDLLPWPVRRVFDPGGSYKQLGKTIKDTGADTLICAASKTRNAWASQRSGVPQRLGFGYNPNVLWFTHPLFVHRSSPPRHEAQFCLDYLRKFDGVEVSVPELPTIRAENLPAPPLDQIFGAEGETEQGFLVVHPGHSGSAAHPTESQYRNLLELLTESGKPVLITCKGTEERELAARLAEGLPGVTELPADLKLLEFASVLEAAAAFFGGSSGPLHLAALLNVPRVGFYSSDPRYGPAKWKPLGGPQLILTPPPDTELHELEVGSLRDRVFQFMDEHGPASRG